MEREVPSQRGRTALTVFLRNAGRYQEVGGARGWVGRERLDEGITVCAATPASTMDGGRACSTSAGRVLNGCFPYWEQRV